MISFGHDGKCFNLRAAAVFIEGDRVLLHRAEYEDFWSLPGGRVEMLERAEDGLRREMQEELHEAVNVGRLLWVAENFFAFQGVAYHEIGLYFLACLPERSPLLALRDEFHGFEDNGVQIRFRWFPLDSLPGLAVNPSFLVAGLAHL